MAGSSLPRKPSLPIESVTVAEWEEQMRRSPSLRLEIQQALHRILIERLRAAVPHEPNTKS